MIFVGWDIYILRFVCYIEAALLTIAYELRHIWDKGDKSDES